MLFRSVLQDPTNTDQWLLEAPTDSKVDETDCRQPDVINLGKETSVLRTEDGRDNTKHS